METKTTPESTDDKTEDLSNWVNFINILGGVCFIATSTFVFIHLGFIVEDSVPYGHSPKPFLTRENLWIVNLCLGTVGGALWGYKKILIGAFSGLCAGAVITGATLLYLFWRDSVFMAELVVPLMTGFVGVGIYKYLKK